MTFSRASYRCVVRQSTAASRGVKTYSEIARAGCLEERTSTDDCFVYAQRSTILKNDLQIGEET